MQVWPKFIYMLCYHHLSLVSDPYPLLVHQAKQFTRDSSMRQQLLGELAWGGVNLAGVGAAPPWPCLPAAYHTPHAGLRDSAEAVGITV